MLSTRAATSLRIGLTGYLILLAGCGGDGGSNTTNVECQPVLNAAASPPGTVLTVGGLPSAMTAPTGSITTDGQTIPAQLTRDPAGTVTLVVPLHPSGRASGGDATLTVSGNGSTCRAVRLSISALPSAPGAAAAATQALQDSVATAGAAFGLTPEQLRGDPDAVPELLRGLQLAQRMLDHPDNPNSLTAILAGTAPVLDGRPVDAALLDGLMTSTGLRAALEEYAAATAAALAPQDSDTELASVVGATAAPGAMPRWLTAATPLAPTTIGSGYSLAYWMKRQDAAARLSGESAQRVVALFETFLAAVAAAGPVGKGISIVGTVALTTVYMTNAYLAAALPFELSDMSVEAFPTVFAEDEKLTGQWRARVTARNKGVTLTLPVALEQAAGSVPWGKGLEKLAETNPAVKAFIEELLSKVSEAVGSALGGAFNVQTGVLLVPQRQWTGIDVSSQRFTRRALSAPGVVELSPTLWQDYQPLAPGETQLTISTFAATINSALERSVPIRVQQIAITVEAERTQMRPGTEQQLMVGVAGAQDLNVTWSASCGTVVAEPGAFATYTAPATEGTCTVTARHVTKTQRSGSVQIQIANVVTVEVTPRSTTLAPGELQAFSAVVEGTQNTEVTWAASRGSITQHGVFTAPQEPGVVTITATSVADPTKSGTARVQVAAALPRYRAVALGGDYESSYNQPRGVDSEGRVLTTGGLWQNGSIIQPSTRQRYLLGIASDGVMVGFDYDVHRSFVYSGGAIIDYGECYVGPRIGPGGRVTGTIYTAPEGRPVEGICQGSGGSYSIIHGLPYGPPPHISAPNASGDAVGDWQGQSVIFRGGSMTALPLGAYTRVAGYDINDAGDILGWVDDGSRGCTAIWRGGSSPEVIGPCSATERLEPVAINNAGLVLAQLSSETGSGYMLGLGDQWVEVESLIVERPAGFAIHNLSGIGESGHLYGQGTDGKGYVLIPVNSLVAASRGR